MKNSHKQKIVVIALSFLLAIILAAPLYAQAENSDTFSGSRSVVVGAFTIRVPSAWTSFNASEISQLHRQYMAQSKEIYSQFSGADDTTKAVDLLAFNMPNNDGSFMLVSLTVPPTSDLIALLKSQVNDKVAWGVREGYIRKYLGFVSVDDERFSGFYTKFIGKSGKVEITGGLEHKKLKNTIIQLTLLSPKAWGEAKATSRLSSILESVTLQKN